MELNCSETITFHLVPQTYSSVLPTLSFEKKKVNVDNMVKASNSVIIFIKVSYGMRMPFLNFRIFKDGDF